MSAEMLTRVREKNASGQSEKMSEGTLLMSKRKGENWETAWERESARHAERTKEQVEGRRPEKQRLVNAHERVLIEKVTTKIQAWKKLCVCVRKCEQFRENNVWECKASWASLWKGDNLKMEKMKNQDQMNASVLGFKPPSTYMVRMQTWNVARRRWKSTYVRQCKL